MLRTLRAFVLPSSIVYLLLGTTVEAADYNAEATFRFFTASCVRSLGQPAEVRSWAAQSRLAPITDPVALSTFAGSGPKGAAWILPSPNDRRFTLSIKGGSETCAVFAEAGDPATADELFRKMVNGAARPGVTIATEDDQNFTTATGKARLLTMTVADKDGEGYRFTLMAGDRTGTFFSGAPIQLSMQMARTEPTTKKR
jgi:hypothetical protein